MGHRDRTKRTSTDSVVNIDIDPISWIDSKTLSQHHLVSNCIPSNHCSGNYTGIVGIGRHGVGQLQEVEVSYASVKSTTEGGFVNAQDPQRHMIFPRTKSTVEDSKWQWLRILLKGRQKINFVREATEGPKDQPTISQYRNYKKAAAFAAILGKPVFHSYSPYFHCEFFEKKKRSFLAIPVSATELIDKVFTFLETLGASAYAVTSPLKEHPVLFAHSTSDEKSADYVCNTLVKGTTWKRYNTDTKAIFELYASSKQNWRIWGSGAVAKQCFEILENAELYSSRSGEKVAVKGQFTGASFNLLWAAGDEAPMPPRLWKPNKVYDLSYAQRSFAILYANVCNVDYENGLEFFKVQALAQQEHWKDL